MVLAWLVLATCFGISIFEHSYLPYLAFAVVGVAVVATAYWRGRLRVAFTRCNWLPLTGFALLGASFCTLVLAAPP